MKIKENIASSLKEMVMYKAVPEKFIVKYFNNLNTELSNCDIPYIEMLLLNKNHDIQLAIINYIKRCCNIQSAVVLLKLLNQPDIKFFIKMEILLTVGKLDRDGKAQAFINKMIDRLSSATEENKICSKISSDKVITLIREILVELIKYDCGLSTINIEVKRIKQYIAKKAFSVAANIENDFDGCIAMNIGESTACEFIKHLYAEKFITLERVDLDDYGIFNNLYIFFERLIEKMKSRFAAEGVVIDFLSPNSFNSQEIILSEKEDNSFIFEIIADEYIFNIGLVIYTDENIRVREFNEVIQNLNIELLDENNHKSICITCKNNKILIEDSGIKRNFQKITGNRILVDSILFKKAMSLYDFMKNEISIDSRLTSKMAAIVDFIALLCDNLSFNARNYLLFKINQVNPFISKSIYQRMTFEDEILKYDDSTSRLIIDNMSDEELGLILNNADLKLVRKVFSNCSHNRIQLIKNFISSINQKTLHRAKIKKASDKFIELIKKHRDSESVYIKRINASIENLFDN